ncbi:hypothetical protein F4553_003208 [Allocatelliglobosispora scoriae]|uniref:YfhO family protein n=1 Tax=Allocatelliglobosispora scoriae TaxID=643052 RepID=A0A841BRK6_9ACTN|nr:hypothetical protein [Allocatelliglobosispora scoriae]MBB5869829.1 hypothetical protein [Allocatelliglobosispora scoriae]
MRHRVALHLAAVTMAILVFAPLLAPGYVLSYDMNFVPDQPMRWDLLAPVDTAPRAVPLDAAVSLANLVLPGWLLQRVVLVGIVWAAVVGAGRLVPGRRLATVLIAGVCYGWTPFLAERLLIGQWGLLLAYAALPWLVRAALGVRQAYPSGEDLSLPQGRRAMAGLLLAAGVSALTPTGGLIAAAVCLVLLIGAPWRRFAAVAAGLAVLNSPWLVAALTTGAGTRSDPDGVAAFAARAENWSGPLGALLATGGIWNADTTPASRGSVAAPLVTLALLVLAAGGYAVLRRRLPEHAGTRLGVIGLAGLVIAALATVPPGAALLRWLIDWAPGAGLLRDGQKFVLPYALLLALCVALGAERLAARIGELPGRVALAGVLLLPVVGMADLAYGASGALRPVHYPADWAAVESILDAQSGEVLSLPLSEYRRYPWNRGRVVIDPAPRYLPLPVLTDDVLVVGPIVVAGENPRLAEVRRSIGAGEPLAATGIRWLLVQHRPAGDTGVAGSVLSGLELRYAGEYLTLYRNPQGGAAASGPGAGLPVIAAEAAALAVLAISAAALAWPGRRRRTAEERRA